MKIIIAGGGKIGYTVADLLSGEGHDLTIIDHDPEVIASISNALDVICVEGSAANPDTLREAGAADADLLLAATQQDEVNMICGISARRLGTAQVVARIRDPEYLAQTEFLRETLDGRTVVARLVEQALMHDDLEKPAVLVDYGNGNHHLELRRQYRYDGVIPDMNLRRIVCFHLADELCRLAGHDPKVDFKARAAALKRLVRERLWDAQAGWFDNVETGGRRDRRWTMQMFKALGWGDWALDRDMEAALVRHLMDESEFLGPYGLHSLSKKDPAYDVNDVDNGGPGACVSFAPAVVDRLYRSGRIAEAELIFHRLWWLADALPYWGDSHYADRMDYRRDTPLQCDIQGAALAQTVIFGLFGIEPRADGTVVANPRLPADVDHMNLTNVRLAGRRFGVFCRRGGGFEVRDDGSASSSH